jgi:hypothetical protein
MLSAGVRSKKFEQISPKIYNAGDLSGLGDFKFFFGGKFLCLPNLN